MNILYLEVINIVKIFKGNIVMIYKGNIVMIFKGYCYLKVIFFYFKCKFGLEEIVSF